jgi:uncharacterized iron-regulated membrane protein
VLRKVIFWVHLTCGVAAGLVIGMMSITGVLLAFERQIVAWADAAPRASPSGPEARLTIDEALRAVAHARPDSSPTSVTLSRDPLAPLVVTAGRNRSLFVNRYTGNVAEPAGQRARAFFEAVEGWHRWLNVTGDRRAIARGVTGACNLAFLFLVLSGVYLWLPRAWAWTALKTRLLFNRFAVSAKARDFNWHHVFGIWSAVPLAIIVASAVVMSYPWANTLVYRAFGEQPPVRGGNRAEGGEPGRGNGAARAADSLPRSDAALPNGSTPSVVLLTYDELFARAAAEAEDWRTLTLTLPAGVNTETVRLGVDRGNGGQPQLRDNLVLEAATGAVRARQPFASQSPGQRTRSWIRFLHTGEALGIAGQVVASAASLASLVMIWTGLALAYRRLVAPIFVRRSKPGSGGAA